MTIFFVYVTYYAKYKAFGDLLEIISVKEPDEIMKNSLKENKPNLLRGYCVFLFILAILSAVGIAVLLFLTVSPVAAIFGIAGAVVYTVAIIISGFITFLCLAIMGCFFDNLAKMPEHYMIKYHLMNE